MSDIFSFKTRPNGICAGGMTSVTQTKSFQKHQIWLKVAKTYKGKNGFENLKIVNVKISLLLYTIPQEHCPC